MSLQFVTPLAATSIPAVVSLLFFLCLFLGILLWVAFGNRHGRFTRDARIPLEDEPVDPIAPRASDRNPRLGISVGAGTAKEHSNG
jgi:cbb3-type cytochrome oxidase subunit 3